MGLGKLLAPKQRTNHYGSRPPQQNGQKVLSPTSTSRPRSRVHKAAVLSWRRPRSNRKRGAAGARGLRPPLRPAPAGACAGVGAGVGQAGAPLIILVAWRLEALRSRVTVVSGCFWLPLLAPVNGM